MSVPNHKSEVDALRRLYPREWRDAHTGSPATEDFIRLLAAHLHKIDPGFGLNGKRGNPNDISDDALNYRDPDGPGTTPDGQHCWVIDVIGGAGGSNPTAQWAVMTDPVASSGAWVKPGPVTPPAPPPPQYPPYPFPEDQVDGAGVFLFADFARAGQAPNPQMFRFAFRVAYSWLVKEVPDLDASVLKHRKEWRQLLGLPPLP